MKKQITWIIVLVNFIACDPVQNKETNESREEKKHPDFPMLLDSAQNQITDLTYKEEIDWKPSSGYMVNYLGPFKDTVYLQFDMPFIPPPVLPPGPGVYYDWDSIDAIRVTESENPFIKYYNYPISTNYRSWDSSKIEIRVRDTEKLKGIYPVLLRNLETDTINIGIGNWIPLLMEAKDSTGRWRAIHYLLKERKEKMGIIFLPPGNIVITTTPGYNGSYETELRLRINENISNTFRGNINYLQFGDGSN